MIDSFSICYHGTVQEYAHNIVKGLNVKMGRPFTDFGQGFYITSNYEQARAWALQKYKIYSESHSDVTPAVVKIYMDAISLKGMQGLVFGEPNDNWAQFVYNCRKVGKNDDLYHDYDYVCGPLADGKFLAVFNRYLKGHISFEEFHAGIRPFTKYHDQLSLHTVQSTTCIQHMEVETIETISLR